MGRPRVHQSNSERQAAYRERKAAAQPKQANWRALAIELHESTQLAAQAGDVAAGDVLGATPEETLQNITQKFNAVIVANWKPL